MNVLQLQEFLDKRVKYKNAYFKVSYDNRDDAIIIKMVARVKDALYEYDYNLAPEIPLTSAEMIREHYFEEMNEIDLLKLIQRMIVRLELHEVDEHFKVDGKCFNDPHPDKQRA